MQVLLRIVYTQEYDIIVDYADSVKDAISGFDPCDDLQNAIPVCGDCRVEGAIEVMDCPECNGKGYHWFKNPDGTANSRGCQKCHGNGYIEV